MADRLCDDELFEILTRTSPETLARCRMVSRHWNKITYEPRFVELHPSRSQTVAGYYVQGVSYGKPWSRFVSIAGGEVPVPDMSLSFLPRGVKIVACDHGILLCRQERCERRPYVPEYYVCKPNTKESVKIPNPKTKYYKLITAINVVRSRPHCLHFKILHISEYPVPSVNGFRCEIFDSETWTWKRLPDMKIPYEHRFYNMESVVVGGKVFWLSQKYMFVFDMHKETWSAVPFSVDSDKKMNARSGRLLCHEGKLGLLLHAKECVDDVCLFVMESGDPINGQAVWRKMNGYNMKEMPGWSVNRLFSLQSANHALIQQWDSKVYVCRCQPPSVLFEMNGNRVDEVFPFHSDLEPSNLMALHNKHCSETKKKPSGVAKERMMLILNTLSRQSTSSAADQN